MAWQDNAKKISSPEEKFEDTAIKSWKSRAKPVEEPRFENVSPQDSPLFSPREKWESERQNMPVDGRKGEEVVQLPTPTPELFKEMEPRDALAVLDAYKRHPRTKQSFLGELEYNGQKLPNEEDILGLISPAEGLVDVAGGIWNAGKETVVNALSGNELQNEMIESVPSDSTIGKAGQMALKVGKNVINPLGAAMDLLPSNSARSVDEAIPEYRSEHGPVGDFLVSAGEWAPGGVAGAKLASKAFKSARPIAKYVGSFLGSEAGGAMTLDNETINTLVGMNIPGLRGLGIDPNGSFDENRVRQKLNQVQDAVILGAALGSTAKVGTKTVSYVFNVFKKIKDWQSLDSYQREFVGDLLGIAGKLNDNMSRQEQNEIMAEIADYVANNSKVTRTFGDPDVDDVNMVKDTITSMIDKLQQNPDANRAQIQILKEFRSSALEGGKSPKLESSLNIPREQLETSFNQAKTAKGGEQAIDQTREAIQEGAERVTGQYRDEVFDAEGRLSKAERDTNEILRKDESLGPKIKEAEEKGVPFDAEASRIESADDIATEAQRAREEVLRPQSDEAYAKIPADSKILDPEGVTEQFERVKSSLSNEAQDTFINLIEDGNYKNLAVDYAKQVRREANNLTDGKAKKDLLDFARFIENSGDEASVKSLREADRVFKENEGKFNQGISKDLRNIPKETDKWANTEILEQNRKTISSGVRDADKREQVQLLREQLSLVGSEDKLDNHIIGEAATDLIKRIDEKGISNISPQEVRSAFNTMAGNLSDKAKGRMESLVKEFEQGKVNVKKLTDTLDNMRKEADRVEVEFYEDKFREFFEKDPSVPGKYRRLPEGYNSFEKMFSNPQNAKRVDDMIKMIDTDPTLKKGAEVAVIKMLEKHLSKEGDKVILPEGFEKLAEKVIPKESIESWKLLTQDAKLAEAANKTRKGSGFNYNAWQEGAFRSTNQLITWVFGVLNPTAARIRTISSDVLKQQNPGSKVAGAVDKLLADPELFAKIARDIVYKNKMKIDPQTKQLIFRGIMNARKDHPDDSGNKSGAKKAMDQTEEILKEKVNPFK